MPPIVTRYSITCYIREADFAGNCYRSFTFTDLETDKQVSFDMGAQTSDSNISDIKYYWNPGRGECREISFNRQLMKARQYDRFTKGWERVAVYGEDLVQLIKQRLGIE